MYQIDFKNPARAYFIGIGGISMSGFAELLHTMGFTVSGSDQKESKITKHLEKMGLHILYGQSSSNITDDIDFIVYTAAIHPDNPEFRAAKEKGIPMLERAVMVGQVMKNYKNAIAIAGTHGKTTTTSMVSHIFLEGDMDPTISVGGILQAIHGNIRIGKSGNFITEACEYTNSYHKFAPTAGIILNVEEDHMDFFKDINEIRESFHTFAKLIPKSGILVINGEIENYKELTADLDCQVITYGLDNTSYDYSATDITFDENGCGSFDLLVHGENAGRFSLQVVGLHNVSNALAAISMALYYGIDLSIIREGLLHFTGTERRFEKKGEIHGVTIIDDYAHHPTEISATLKAAADYPHKTMWCVFQPHTYTRTKAFLQDFAKALTLADQIVLTDIYAAREQDPGDISSKDLQAAIQTLGKECHYFPSFDLIENFLLENCTQGDLLITMGAGDVVTIGEALLHG